MGQESYLHPAVLEFALARSLPFVDVRQSPNFLGLRAPPLTYGGKVQQVLVDHVAKVYKDSVSLAA